MRNDFLQEEMEMLSTDAALKVMRRMTMSATYRNNLTILCPQSHRELFRAEERGPGATAERDKDERSQGRETEKMPYPTLHDMREATDQGEAPRSKPRRNTDLTTSDLRGHLTLCGHLKSH